MELLWKPILRNAWRSINYICRRETLPVNARTLNFFSTSLYASQKNQRLLENIEIEPKKVDKVDHARILQKLVDKAKASDPSLNSADYFQVHSLFTVKDLFEARVHLGHKYGGRNPHMNDFIFGTRFGTDIIDLDQTAFHLRQALNITAHVAYRGGIILFVTRSPSAMNLVEKTAIESGEYAHCREWNIDVLTNSMRKFGGITRLPDLIIVLNTLDTVMLEHRVIAGAAKMLIPTVAIVDTNCDPNLVTFPVPGNDDSLPAVSLYCKLFKEAILRGKAKRKIDHENVENTSKTTEPASQS